MRWGQAAYREWHPAQPLGLLLVISFCLETAGAEGRRAVEARTVNRAHQTPVLLLQGEMCITMATVAKDAQGWAPQMGRRLGDHTDPVSTPPAPPLSPALAEALIWHSSSSPAMPRLGRAAVGEGKAEVRAEGPCSVKTQ